MSKTKLLPRQATVGDIISCLEEGIYNKKIESVYYKNGIAFYRIGDKAIPDYKAFRGFVIPLGFYKGLPLKEVEVGKEIPYKLILLELKGSPTYRYLSKKIQLAIDSLLQTGREITFN